MRAPCVWRRNRTAFGAALGAPSVLMLVALAVSASTRLCAQQRPAVAFVSRHFTTLDRYDVLPDLRNAGFGVGTLKWQAVNADSLKPFNAVVLTDIPCTSEKSRPALRGHD